MNNRKNEQSHENSLHPHLASASRIEEDVDAGISRRGCLGFAAASLFLGPAGGQCLGSDSKKGGAYRTLGRSKEKVSLIGLGGYHLGNQADLQESIRIIRTGLDEGVNFLDNCCAH